MGALGFPTKGRSRMSSGDSFPGQLLPQETLQTCVGVGTGLPILPLAAPGIPGRAATFGHG